MTVISNIGAAKSSFSLARSNSRIESSLLKLSTGSKINSASDDAAGLAMKARMSSQIKGLSMAVKNAMDATSLLSTADGALAEVESILQRMRELSIQSSNGTHTAEDRSYMDMEYQQLKAEINRIGANTQWNGTNLLDGKGFPGTIKFHVDSSLSEISISLPRIASPWLGQGGFTDLLFTGPDANPLTSTIQSVTQNDHLSWGPPNVFKQNGVYYNNPSSITTYFYVSSHYSSDLPTYPETQLYSKEAPYSSPGYPLDGYYNTLTLSIGGEEFVGEILRFERPSQSRHDRWSGATLYFASPLTIEGRDITIDGQTGPGEIVIRSTGLTTVNLPPTEAEIRVDSFGFGRMVPSATGGEYTYSEPLFVIDHRRKFQGNTPTSGVALTQWPRDIRPTFYDMNYNFGSRRFDVGDEIALRVAGTQEQLDAAQGGEHLYTYTVTSTSDGKIAGISNPALKPMATPFEQIGLTGTPSSVTASVWQGYWAGGPLAPRLRLQAGEMLNEFFVKEVEAVDSFPLDLNSATFKVGNVVSTEVSGKAVHFKVTSTNQSGKILAVEPLGTNKAETQAGGQIQVSVTAENMIKFTPASVADPFTVNYDPTIETASLGFESNSTIASGDLLRITDSTGKIFDVSLVDKSFSQAVSEITSFVTSYDSVVSEVILDGSQLYIVGKAGASPDEEFTFSTSASLASTGVASAEKARASTGTLDKTISELSGYRATIGATINRLEHAIDGLMNTRTNLEASVSRITDTNYAEETAELAKAQIINRASIAMLAQAQMRHEDILTLIRGVVN